MNNRRNTPSAGREPPGEVRVIGGRWRGRLLQFTAAEGLRPTPNRVRETLFNWLQGDIQGSTCLDLFCGSGALGIEALSRGAAHATLLDTSAAAVRDVRATLARFGDGSAEVIQAEAIGWLGGRAGRRYDIVFIDPPFDGDLAERALAAVAAAGVLRPGALVYLEMAAGHAAPELPAGWTLHREKLAGQVAYRLCRCPEA